MATHAILSPVPRRYQNRSAECELDDHHASCSRLTPAVSMDRKKTSSRICEQTRRRAWIGCRARHLNPRLSEPRPVRLTAGPSTGPPRSCLRVRGRLRFGPLANVNRPLHYVNTRAALAHSSAFLTWSSIDRSQHALSGTDPPRNRRGSCINDRSGVFMKELEPTTCRRVCAIR